MKEQLEKFMDWLWLNHNILTDADKNKVALEQYLASEDGKQALSLFSVSNNEVAICPICRGKGEVQQTDIDWDDCRRCNGTGQTDC